MNSRVSILLVFICLVIGFSKGACQAEQYHKTNKSQFKHAIKELYKLGLSGSEKILDIGSGDGLVSSHIAREYIPNGTLTGIDSSAEMISFATANNTEPNVSYECIDAMNYSMPKEYDAIVSFWTLHWVSDYETVLDNIARSLKPGGKALLCHGVETPLLKVIAERLLETEKWNDYKEEAQLLTYPTLRQVSLAIEKSGLMIDSLEVKKNGTWMPVDDVIKNWNSLSMFDFIPFAFREQFCREILNEFIHDYPLNEKNEVFRWAHVLVMILQK